MKLSPTHRFPWNEVEIGSEEPRERIEYFRGLIKSLKAMYENIADTINRSELDASAVWDPGSIADGNEEAKEVTISGATLEDFAIASFSLDVNDLTLDAQVTAVNTVTCILANNTGGAIDLGSGTIFVRVIKK